jgi:hypothetical protein
MESDHATGDASEATTAAVVDSESTILPPLEGAARVSAHSLQSESVGFTFSGFEVTQIGDGLGSSARSDGQDA